MYFNKGLFFATLTVALYTCTICDAAKLTSNIDNQNAINKRQQNM